MIPGTVSKLSESIISLANTITPKTEVVRVSSTATTTVVVTINPVFPQNNQFMILVNSSGGTITGTTAGNIATTVSIPNGCMCSFVYSKSSGKWHADKTT